MPTSPAFNAPVRGVPVGILWCRLAQKNKNDAATRRWKNFDNMFIRCDTTHERGGHLCRVAGNAVWSYWQVTSRSSEVNFTKNYTLLYLFTFLHTHSDWRHRPHREKLYYIHGPWGDENISAVLCVTLLWALHIVIKQQFLKTFIALPDSMFLQKSLSSASLPFDSVSAHIIRVCCQ